MGLADDSTKSGYKSFSYLLSRKRWLPMGHSQQSAQEKLHILLNEWDEMALKWHAR